MSLSISIVKLEKDSSECFVNGKQKIAKGKAYFKKSTNIGSLKVTFFWPFYGNYNVMTHVNRPHVFIKELKLKQ